MITSRHLLPEWAKQSAIMLTWPHQLTDWVNDLDAVEAVYRNIVKEVTRRECVLIVSNSPSHQTHIKNQLTEDQLARSIFAIAESNDSWCRDHGPITVVENNQLRLLDFQFNGWGNKYPAKLDNAINTIAYQQNIFSCTMDTLSMVLEGGSIDTDGAGTLLTTEQCLLTPTRNAGYSKQRIEDELSRYLGIQQVLWLKHGHLAGDDTDGHIDTLARFCNENTIVFCSCDKEDTEHYDSLIAMRNELMQFKNIHGEPYTLIELPLPSPIYDKDQRLPATYANFIIINDAVLMPGYNDPQDTIAMQQLASAFPGRKIIGINCLPIIKQYGSLHCITMQLPRGTLNSC